jgi:hypothetical protein
LKNGDLAKLDELIAAGVDVTAPREVAHPRYFATISANLLCCRSTDA